MKKVYLGFALIAVALFMLPTPPQKAVAKTVLNDSTDYYKEKVDDNLDYIREKIKESKQDISHLFNNHVIAHCKKRADE